MSDSLRRPRPDSVLKTLPEERQRSIIEKCGEPKWTYKRVCKWLAEDGIVTSQTALADFWQWWHLRQRWEAATSSAREVETLLQAADTSLSPEQIEAYGQAVFLNEAISAGGAEGLKGFVSVSKLRLAQKSFEAEKAGFKLKYEQKEREIEQRERQIILDREKFEFDAAKKAIEHAAAIKTIATNRSLDSDARVEQVRLRLFGAPPTSSTEVSP